MVDADGEQRDLTRQLLHAMNIEEAIAEARQMPEGSVLVAKPPFTWGAEAKFVMLTEEFGVPAAATDAGFSYLLELDEILELLDFLKTKLVSSKTAAEFVIYYAVYDASPAWIEDIPDGKRDPEPLW